MSIMIGGKPKKTSTPAKKKEVSPKGGTSNAIAAEEDGTKKTKKSKKDN